MSEFAQSGVPAPGTMHVDFEERVDFDRLRTHRLARARDALGSSELGSLLCFDMNNIRYLTSTNIGEWARDKLMRFAVLAGEADPVLWDFGSAAKAHRLHSPWLRPEDSRAGMTGLRGSIAPDAGFFARAAREVKGVMDGAGVGDMPLGVDIAEIPMMGALADLGVDVRDGQQTMLDARQIKSRDEIMLLSTIAAAVDSSMISSRDLICRASSMVCWPSRTSTPRSARAPIIGISAMSTPSGMSPTPAPSMTPFTSRAARAKKPASGAIDPRRPVIPARESSGRSHGEWRRCAFAADPKSQSTGSVSPANTAKRISLSRAHSPMFVLVR